MTALWPLRLRGSKPGLIANGLGFASGVGVLFLLPSLPPLWPPLLLAVPAVAVAWRWPLLRPFAYALAGFLWAWIQVCQVLCGPFPETLVRRDLELTGRIAGLPGEAGDGGARFLFQVEHTRADGRAIGFDGLVRLSWYRNAPALRAGERWRLTARLKLPHGFANPGGFDYERWLFQQGIEATGYVRGAGENLRLDAGSGIYVIDRWRQGLRERIREILPDATGEALVRALVLGDRSGLGPEQWEVLTRTGTNHLIAISGLHVGMVAAFLFFLSRWVWSRSVRLILLIAAPRAGAIAALVGAVAYSALAGFAVSTQRALIMLAVILGAVLSSRTVRPASGIVLALVGVLILDPQAVLAYGFWLSFAAVAVLLAAFGQRLGTNKFRRNWGRAQWVVALGLLPLLLLLFGRAPVVAPLVNLVAVPLFSLVLLPVVLTASLLGLLPGLGLELPLVLTAQLLEGEFGLLEVVSGWDWAAVTVSRRPIWVWVGAFAGVLLLLAPRGLPGAWLGSLFLLPLALIRPPVPSEGTAEFTLLDVGQGLAAVVRTRRHVLVYDTGPRFPSGFNTGAAVILPYLHHQGVRHIDTLIISHADRDHAGGFAGLNGKLPIGRILSGEPRELAGGRARPCLAGNDWTWDGVDFELLYPATAGRKGNPSSCVLRVNIPGAGSSVLLTGDIDAGVEDGLVATQHGRLASTILVAGHHGSATSTGTAFLAAVAPRFVLYAAGYANRFGLPNPAVRERVAVQGAAQLDTASAGAISFRLGPTGIEGPWSFRREHKRLWSHRVQPISNHSISSRKGARD
ncbi:DNA internalization-related competence protein ComEC/Rec2 [Candidatus Thiosymbion oneisti]|uniref:DNA internalization-related competence protein ComEC/Rec2 n=1 Tax=Candidatus Thiosymbion oneisti TaxID=589554 RepID=UPI000ABBAE2D|nr:DNA internalization-related competence protein ComEC/Rec2 [Candidatus Thiosymbion oneisti]